MQKLKNDPFNRWMLQFLLDLIETRRLGLSAEKFGLSTAGASRALDKLRETFENPLFTVNGRGLTPTAFMLSLKQTLQTTDRALDQLYTPTRFCAATTQRVFKLASRGLIGPQLLTDLTLWLMQEAPLARIEHRYRTSECFELLMDDRLDFVICTDLDVPESLHSYPLCDIELGILARRSHPLMLEFQGKAPTLAAFNRFRRVGLMITASSSKATFDRQILGFDDERVLLRTNDPLTALPLLEQSDVLMLCPKSGALSVARSHDLAWIPLPKGLPSLTPATRSVVVWSATRHHDEAHIWMRSLFQRWAADYRRTQCF